MTIEGERPRLNERKHPKKGRFVFAAPSEEPTDSEEEISKVDVKRLMKEIRDTTKYRVSKARGKSSRTRRS